MTVFPGAVVGRPPVTPEISMLKINTASPGEVQIGDNCVIGSNTVIYAGAEIGNHTVIGDTVCIREQCRIGSSCLIATGVTISCNARIGNHVEIMDNSHITGNMIIEDRGFISPFVIATNDNLMGRKGNRVEKGPVIRRVASIGPGACLFPGVEIGAFAIVGANSLVTKNVELKAVVIGVPAKLRDYVRDYEIFPE